MFFTYWTNGSSAIAPEREADFKAMVADWTSKFPAFRVFSDADVEPLLDPEFAALFRRIRIPACKSDIARLILLREFGGLYVDAHTGTGHGDVLSRVLELLATRDLILFDKRAVVKTASDKHIVNGAMVARRGAEPLRDVIADIRTNLVRHAAAEAASADYVPYNIFVITGSWSIGTTLFDRGDATLELKAKYADRIHVEPIDPEVRPWPCVFYKFYGYREPGKHWSERQNSERLFSPA